MIKGDFMGSYHFEKDNGDFGETRRIDGINKEIQNIESGGNKKRHDSDRLFSIENRDKEPSLSFSFKTIIIFVVIGIIVMAGFAFLFFNIVSGRNGQNNIDDNNGALVNSGSNEETDNQNFISCAVVSKVLGKKIDINRISGESETLQVSNSTVITDANGRRISLGDIETGDVISIILSDDGAVSEISFPDDIWQYSMVNGINVDIDKMRAEYDGQIYSYNDDTVFSYMGNEIYPGDVSETDIVSIYGKGQNIISLKVNKYHGYVVLKNSDKINDMQIKVDFEEIEVPESMVIPLAAGKHTILVSGSNIDDYMSEIDVGDNENIEIDLSEAAKSPHIVLNVNVSNYNVFINGQEYPQNTTEVAVESGVYDIRITSEGYRDFTRKVDCSNGSVNIDIKLEKIQNEQNTSGSIISGEPPKNSNEKPVDVKEGNLTIMTDPGWMRVYVDGEYIGVSPVMVKLEYGEHTVRAVDSNNDDNMEEVKVTVDGPDKTVTVEF